MMSNQNQSPPTADCEAWLKWDHFTYLSSYVLPSYDLWCRPFTAMLPLPWHIITWCSVRGRSCCIRGKYIPVLTKSKKFFVVVIFKLLREKETWLWGVISYYVQSIHTSLHNMSVWPTGLRNSNKFSVQWNFIYNRSKFDTRMLYAGISFQKKSPLLNITKAGTKIRQIYVATSPRCSTHCVQRLSASIPKSFIRKSQGFILKRMLGCCKTFIIHWCIKVFWNSLPWISCWIIFHPWSIIP